MISTLGAQYVKRYLAGQVGSIAESVAFGVGDSAEIPGSTTLDMEISRTDVDLVSYDFINDYVVFKAALPEDLEGTIYEVAIYSQSVNELAGDYGSKLITTFDSDSEPWVGGSFVTTNTRVGLNNLRMAPTTSTTSTATLSDLFFDFSGNSGSDNFVLAYNNNNTNASSINISFVTDASNYYTYTITNPTIGYHIVELPKATGTVNGAPDWGFITQLSIAVTAKSSGAASVDFDAIRIRDTDTNNPDYVLIAREKLLSPYTKSAGQNEEIEFNLKVIVA